VDDVTLLSWISKGKNVAAFLVAIGVAGEFLGDWLSGPANKRIESARQEEMARLHSSGDSMRKEMADAIAREKEADARIAEAQRGAADAQRNLALAEQHSAEANTKAELFRLDIAKAQESAAKAQAQVAGATAEAAKANLELAKLKTPRSLSSEQQQRIIAKLRPFPGQKFCFAAYPDPEALALMHAIEAILTSSGWIRTPSQIGDVEVDGAGITYGSGVEVHIAPADLDGLKTVLAILVAALSAEGLPSVAHTNPQMTGKSPKTINIVVGKKP
jgi:multidrug efflux pump subunit AcrA (membrane-fusion protein)